MLETLRVWPQIRQQIAAGPLGEHVDAFVARLHEDGYRRSVIRRYVQAVQRFGAWLARQRLTARDVDEATVGRFAARLGRRRCTSRPRGRPPELASGVRTFAKFLWAQGVAIRDWPRPETVADHWLRAFDDHLTRVRGVSAGTRRIYRRYARAFLATRFGTAAPDWSALTTSTITDFVRTHAARLTASAPRAPATATRALLRFLVTRGAIPTGLEGAVPVIRQWKLGGLPRALSPADVERVLEACPLALATGVRDRVALLLLARLGLRAGEVAALRLDDLDWAEGRLRVRAGKFGRERSLPLPQDVGTALVTFLRGRRAARGCRTVFTRARPPYGPLAAATVTSLAQQALRRAGITIHRPGAHTFRHTAATQMVRAGASFKAVADVLGHARLETTAIYAKLDLATLAEVALPWPGAQP